MSIRKRKLLSTDARRNIHNPIHSPYPLRRATTSTVIGGLLARVCDRAGAVDAADERRGRHDALFEVLMANDVESWSEW